MIEPTVVEWVMRALEPYLDSTLTPTSRRRAALDVLAAINPGASTSGQAEVVVERAAQAMLRLKVREAPSAQLDSDPALIAALRKMALSALMTLEPGNELPHGTVQAYGALTEVAMSHRREGSEVARAQCAELAFNWPPLTPAFTIRTPGQQISAGIMGLEIDLL